MLAYLVRKTFTFEGEKYQINTVLPDINFLADRLDVMVRTGYIRQTEIDDPKDVEESLSESNPPKAESEPEAEDHKSELIVKDSKELDGSEDMGKVIEFTQTPRRKRAAKPKDE